MRVIGKVRAPPIKRGALAAALARQPAPGDGFGSAHGHFPGWYRQARKSGYVGIGRGALTRGKRTWLGCALGMRTRVNVIPAAPDVSGSSAVPNAAHARPRDAYAPYAWPGHWPHAPGLM